MLSRCPVLKMYINCCYKKWTKSIPYKLTVKSEESKLPILDTIGIVESHVDSVLFGMPVSQLNRPRRKIANRGAHKWRNNAVLRTTDSTRNDPQCMTPWNDDVGSNSSTVPTYKGFVCKLSWDMGQVCGGDIMMGVRTCIWRPWSKWS